jgi:hypothetical protein
MSETFRCESCQTTFEHPDTAGECESVGSHCALLVRAGWKPVWVRVITSEEGQPDRHVFSRGGWFCPECVTKYVDPPKQARHRKRVKMRRYRNHDRELS